MALMRLTSIFSSVILALILFGAVLAIREQVTTPPVNIVLLTVESLRADRFTPVLAPKFFAAARQASVYKNHRGIASWTAPNIIALLTGLSPFKQGVHARGQSIPGGRMPPLQKLAKEGWTIGSVQAFAKSENFENIGMRVIDGEGLEGWIARRALAGQPFFFWHHYLETHLPYNPPTAFLPTGFRMPDAEDPASARIKALRRLPSVREGSVKFEARDKPIINALYDGGIREFDAWFQNFWQFLNMTGLRHNTLLIVTADHGEELLERGNVGHASTTRAGTLFEEVVRIPLFVWWPEGFENIARIENVEPTDHLDIMPTIFDILDIPPGSTFPGGSLRDRRESYRWHAITSRAGFAEENPDNIRRFIAATADGRWKLVAETDRREVRKIELYDLRVDPGEREEISASHPDIVRQLLPSLTTRMASFVLPNTGGQRETAKGGNESEAGPGRPNWIFPTQSRTVSWEVLKGRAYLEWSGNPSRRYVLEYKAGSGVLAVSGEIVVPGTTKDFGKFSRKYWDTWVVPYGEITFRVRDEANKSWSAPLVLSLAE